VPLPRDPLVPLVAGTELGIMRLHISKPRPRGRTEERAMSNFAHIELNTSDPDKSKRFYGSLFGWKFEKMPMPGGMAYFMVKGADGPTVGLWQKPMPEAPDCWLGYVAVASAPKAVAKARQLGAQVMAEGIVVPGIGEWAVMLDPTGGAFGVWAPEKAMKTAKKAASKPKKTPKAAKKTVQKARKAPKAAKKTVQKARKAPKR
jgi:predicted enzyme related to lactoylglutathione lyase